MKVLQVCPYDFARPGGVQRHVRDLSRALERAGHAVGIAAPGPGGDPGIRYIGTRRPWAMHGTTFELTWAARRELDALAAQPFDVVHVHTPWTPCMPWQVLARLAPLASVRVATFHDTPPPGWSGALQRAIYGRLSRRLSRRLDAMIAVSASVERHLRPRDGCPVYRLPPCIDLGPYRALRSRGAGSTVLFVGRLEPRKGVLLLIEALSRLAGARLIVCGDGPERAAAEALARVKGVAVRFTGAVAESAKLALYGEADVFCAPSPYGESYGLVIAEAMAAGLPVVAAANDGYRTVLDGEGAVRLCVPGSVAALAQTLGRFLEHGALRERLAAWGRREAARADVDARLAEFLAVYERSKGLGCGSQRSSSART